MGSVSPPPDLKPTILLIHGAWHVPKHYQLLTDRLEAAGYAVVVPHLPTCNNADPPNLATVDDDVKNIRQVMQKLVADDKRVIALMHSYGGIIGSAALGEFVAVDGGAGLIALAYMSAFIPFEQESLAGIFGGTLPPFLTPDDKTPFLLISDPGGHFYSDLSPEEQNRWAAELVRHPAAAQANAPQLAGADGNGTVEIAWRKMSGRTWYLVCDGDQALPPFVQEMMIGRVEKQGCKVKVERCSASHSPFLSMPDRVVAYVNYVANETA